MSRQRIKGTGVVVSLLLAALTVPLFSGPGAGAALAPGCTARGVGIHSCSYTTAGGSIVFAAAPGGGIVYWGPPGDPFQNRCDDFNMGNVGRCRVNGGNVVTAVIVTGVITVRDLPARL